MNIAYLLFVYKNPRLIAREISKLSTPRSAFFIHVDAKSNIGEFSGIRGEKVFFSRERIPVYWAEFSGVRAIMHLIEQALEHSSRYDYLFLLSGSEYPLRTPVYIERFLEANHGAEFITLTEVPGPGKPLSRITTIRYESDKPLRRLAMRLFASTKLAQRDLRKHLGNLTPYSGRTWWALTRQACEYVLQYSAEHPQVRQFFRDTFAPEESFFHTILGNSPFRSSARGNLFFEDWSEYGSHPKMITAEHIDFFESTEKVVDSYDRSSELLFARKFSDHTYSLLPRMDQMAAQKDSL